MVGWARYRAKYILMNKAFENKKMLKNKVAILIFIVAAAVRIFYIFSISHAPLENDAKEYHTLGISLAEGKGYVSVSGNPTAVRPPIYPIFLGAIYYFTGCSLLWVRLIQALVGAGICILVYFIALIIFNKTIANLSSGLCCVYPPLIVDTSQIMTETLFTFLLLLAIWLIISRDHSLNLFLSGLVFGLSLLTRSFIIFFFPLLLFWLVLHKKSEAPKTIAIVFIGLLIVLMPWTLRNTLKLQAFVPFSNMGGLALYNSYMVPEKGFGFNSLAGVDDEYFRIDNESERDKFLTKTTIEYIIKNPTKAIRLAPIKLLHFIYPFDGYWYPVSFGSKYNIFWGMILSFSLIGIVSQFRKHNINLQLIYFLFISFLFGILVFYGSPRFRLPIEPLLICFAVSGFNHLIKEKSYLSSIVVVINIMLFIIFRSFNLQIFFDYLKVLV
jgi:4-amino-4-deoxy-L-arabinose transferase-like glycosyltransferase